MRPHKCDESCRCPEDGLPLLWNRATDTHACQDPQCRYAHGIFTEVHGVRIAL
jgi:hypothetical protein